MGITAVNFDSLATGSLTSPYLIRGKLDAVLELPCQRLKPPRRITGRRNNLRMRWYAA